MKEKQKNQELPYERFLRFGPESLTETELLAIIIRTGTRDCNAMELAKKVLALAEYPKEGLLGLHDIPLERLMEIRGIGEVKAVKLKCIAELSMRMSSSRAREGVVFRSSSQVADSYMERLRHKGTECVLLLCLDVKGRLLKEKRISEGSVKMSLISPREILMEALASKAVEMILLHNHPSGDPTPSRADLEMTANLKELSEKMDIPLLDHIIIGDNRYISFMEENWFQNK